MDLDKIEDKSHRLKNLRQKLKNAQEYIREIDKMISDEWDDTVLLNCKAKERSCDKCPLMKAYQENENMVILVEGENL